tara:strand:- start:358 stop:498 length:141 start_codon:yes stop_codon:yes gene_type:complete
MVTVFSIFFVNILQGILTKSKQYSIMGVAAVIDIIIIIALVIDKTT